MSESGYKAYKERTMRPAFMARKGVVSSGHGLASLAGEEVLRKGGNAFDAGVATAICLNILQPDYAGFVGVSPFIGYSAAEQRVLSYSGVGVAPRRATIDFFRDRGYTTIPRVSILSQLIPASVDTWVAILARLGTMSFSDVSATARSLAFDGFPAHRQMIDIITQKEEIIRGFPYNSSIFFQTGGIPRLGELFVQKDAARSIDIMCSAEKSMLTKGATREQALESVRSLFYEGEIARAIATLHEEEEGLIAYEDLASFRGVWEEPLSTTYRGYSFFTPGTWTQAPLLIQYLNILEYFALHSLGHNSPEYVHTVSSAIDLGMADRERFYGDPRFVDVSNGLWTKEYAALRRLLISSDKAFREMPPPGDPMSMQAVLATPTSSHRSEDNTSAGDKPTDTTYVCAADAAGNLFSMTPSDGGYGSPIVPGYGIILGGRMTQFRLTPGHNAALEPGKRPTITPAPALVLKDGRPFMALGTPGEDQQTQSMLQTFLNVVDFHMNIQEAIEAPKFGSSNYPGWFSPHTYYPGRLCIERRLADEVGEQMRGKGRSVVEWDDWTMLAGGVCAVLFDYTTGSLHAGADPRRECYAVGW